MLIQLLYSCVFINVIRFIRVVNNYIAHWFSTTLTRCLVFSQLISFQTRAREASRWISSITMTCFTARSTNVTLTFINIYTARTTQLTKLVMSSNVSHCAALDSSVSITRGHYWHRANKQRTQIKTELFKCGTTITTLCRAMCWVLETHIHYNKHYTVY